MTLAAPEVGAVKGDNSSSSKSIRVWDGAAGFISLGVERSACGPPPTGDVAYADEPFASLAWYSSYV